MSKRKPDCDCTAEGKAIHVINIEQFGAVHRCKDCDRYWCFQPDRLWDDETDPDFDDELIFENAPKGQTPVFFGPGEIGLASLLTIHNDAYPLGASLIDAVCGRDQK